MRKSTVLLSVLLIGAVASASFFALEWQHERERADALAVRAFEHEPVEEGAAPSQAASVQAAPMQAAPQLQMPAIEAASAPIAEPPVVVPAEHAPPATRKSVMDYSGSLRAREQVNRLQMRLSKGTPLEDYQIRALIEALDEVYSEQTSAQQTGGPPEVYDDRMRQRIFRVSSDILFESQLEVFMEIIEE